MRNLAKKKALDFAAYIKESIALKQALLADESWMSQLQLTADVLLTAYEEGHKVLLCGNGGSAADAQHIAAELTGRFYKDRPPLDAEALHVNTSYLTAVANDYGYDAVYARLVKARGQAGDVLVAISTSGNSPNILAAATAAREQGVTVVALTGKQGGELAQLADHLVAVPSADTPRIQEVHILVGHMWCAYIESSLFGEQ